MITQDYLAHLPPDLVAAACALTGSRRADFEMFDDRTLAEALAAVAEFPFIELEGEHIDLSLYSSISNECSRFRFLPLGAAGTVRIVAMAEPWHPPLLQAVRNLFEAEVRPIVVTEHKIDMALATASMLGPRASAGFEKTTFASVAPILCWPLFPEDGQNGALRTVSAIIARAHAEGASDIHLDPESDRLRVRFRVDDRGIVMPPIRGSWARKIVDAVKIKALIPINETACDQKGRISELTSHGLLDLRVEVIPSLHGQSIVMRLLDPRKLRSLSGSLPFPFLEALKVQAILNLFKGMVLLVGPTGSGKTTTLLRMLTTFDNKENVICTIEEPVEYTLPGVRQMDVSNGKLTYHRALKSCLRQDPDVIMVGEIRDLETAEIAIMAGQTGHLLLSTLHTYDTTETISRFILLGCNPRDVAGTTSCIIAQRLAPKLCPYCKTSVPTSVDTKRHFLLAGLESPPAVFVGKGCSRCYGEGTKGRIPVFEILIMTEELRGLVIADFDPAAFRKRWKASGGVSLAVYALELVREGEVDPKDIASLIGELG